MHSNLKSLAKAEMKEKEKQRQMRNKASFQNHTHTHLSPLSSYVTLSVSLSLLVEKEYSLFLSFFCPIHSLSSGTVDHGLKNGLS